MARHSRDEFWYAARFARALGHATGKRVHVTCEREEANPVDVWLKFSDGKRVGVQLVRATNPEDMIRTVRRTALNARLKAVLDGGLPGGGIAFVQTSDAMVMAKHSKLLMDFVLSLARESIAKARAISTHDFDDEAYWKEMWAHSITSVEAKALPGEHGWHVNFVFAAEVPPPLETLQAALDKKIGKYGETAGIWLGICATNPCHSAEEAARIRHRLRGLDSFGQTWWIYPTEKDAEILRLDI